MENLTSQNDLFLQRVNTEIDNNLEDEHYSVNDLAASVGLSRSMLHRKLKKMTGHSAHDLITLKRLEKACKLLRNNVANASEVAYMVGFNSPSYFSKVFKKHYKFSPGELKKHPERHTQSASGVGSGKKILSKRIVKYIAAGLVIIAVLLIYIFVNAWTSLPFNKRDWIVISDFENHTGETIFDKSLNTAFVLSISQSRFINVITRQRMLEALKRMKKEDQSIIDEGICREIALREGVNICIVPGISRIGSRYILTAKILDANTTEVLKSEVIYAKNQDDIIKQMDHLTRKIRRNLGESMYMISRQSVPLSKVTTPSLEALEQFSMGLDYHINMNFNEAVMHYENALEIDTGFTAAKASLGNILYERYDKKRGLELLNEVIKSIDDLTARERYNIMAKYAGVVENDMNKAIDYTKTLLELYPDDPTAYNNLGYMYRQQDLLEKSINAYKAALQLDPYMLISYGGIIWIYLDDLGRMDSALIWTKKFIKHAPDNPYAYFYLGSSYTGMDSLKAAENAFREAWHKDPDFFLNTFRLANVLRLLERYNEAIKLLEEIAYKSEDDVIAHYQLGIIYDLLGEKSKARYHYNIFHEAAKIWLEEYPDNPYSYIRNAMVLTRLGDKERGSVMGQKAMEIDSTMYLDFTALLIAQEREEEAFDYLEKALKNGYRNLAWLKLNPDLFPLQTQTRFEDLLEKYIP